jgi:hypothetical protein
MLIDVNVLVLKIKTKCRVSFYEYYMITSSLLKLRFNKKARERGLMIGRERIINFSG